MPIEDLRERKRKNERARGREETGFNYVDPHPWYFSKYSKDIVNKKYVKQNSIYCLLTMKDEFK